MKRNQVHNNQKGYSIWKGKLLKFLKKRNFTLSDIATKIGISERELQERLDDWDYWNAEEIERIVEFFGAKAAYDIIHFPSRKEKTKIKKKAFGGNKWQKRKD